MSDNEDDPDGGDRVTFQRDGGKRKANDGGPSLGEVFECLTSYQRRLILYYLQDHEIADIDELAMHIATQGATASTEEVSSDHCDRIKTQLVHTHLPKLAAIRCIEYDPRSGTIRYTQPPALLERALRLLSRLEERPTE